MRSLVHALYRQSLAAASTFGTHEEQTIAKTRFVEFLPPLFTLPNDNESPPDIVRRAFRFGCKSEPDKAKAISCAFQFIKDVQRESMEVEVLAHWARSTASSGNAPRKSATPVVSVDPRLPQFKSWIDGVVIISYAYYQQQRAIADADASTAPKRKWKPQNLWSRRMDNALCDDDVLASLSGATSSKKKRGKGGKGKGKKLSARSVAPPTVNPSSSSGGVVLRRMEEPESEFSIFKKEIDAQLDALIQKVKTALVVEQIALAENSIRVKPKRTTVREDSGITTIYDSTSPTGSKSERYEKQISAKSVKIYSSLSPENIAQILAGVAVETIVRAALRVLLEDLKFAPVTVSPLEGFLIDKVLATRIGSVSVMSVLFATICQSLGVDCHVTMDQRCPMVRVDGFRGVTCFVNLGDGGTILSPDEALEYHVKSLQNATQARTALKGADPKVVYCGILASLLVATHGVPDEHASKTMLRAQLLFLSRLH